MKFVMQFELKPVHLNEFGFPDYEQIAITLHSEARRIERGLDYGTVRDVNGNIHGEFEIVRD